MPHLFVDYMKPKFLSIENKKILIFLCHFMFFFVSLQRLSIKRTYAECAEGMVEGILAESLFMGKRLSSALFLDVVKSGSFNIQSRDKATIDAHGMINTILNRTR